MCVESKANSPRTNQDFWLCIVLFWRYNKTMMTELGGMPIDFNWGKLYKIADLIVCDGPLLSHYSTCTGDQYLLYWLDSDETCNRWMVVRTNLGALRQYVNREIPLLQLLESPEDGFVWIIDMDEALNLVHSETLPVSLIPQKYLPEPEAMYEFENTDPLLQEKLDTYELNLPESDSGLFRTIIERMGWLASEIKLSRKVAVF